MEQRGDCRWCLCRDVCVDQWAALEGVAVVSAGGGVAGGGVDGGHGGDDTGAGLSGGGLQHNRAVAGDDAHRRVLAHGGIFRVGGGLDFASCANAATVVAIGDVDLGDVVGVAGQRHGVSVADAVGGGGHCSGAVTVVAIPDGVGDERQHGECGDIGR